MTGIATEALKDVAKAEERLSAIDKELEDHREQYEEATRELRAEREEQRKVISSRLADVSREYGGPVKASRKRAPNGSSAFDEASVLAFVAKATQPVSAGELRSVSGDVSSQTLSNHLARLVEEGKLTKQGAKRGTRYSSVQ